MSISRNSPNSNKNTPHRLAQVKRFSLYDERRRYMLGRLRKMGFGIPHDPQGAFYIFADARHFTTDIYIGIFCSFCWRYSPHNLV